jgi:hypothetical protein
MVIVRDFVRRISAFPWRLFTPIGER